MIHHLFRKFHREVKSLYDGHDIRSRIIDVADHLRHEPFRILLFSAVGGQLYNHLMSGHGSFFLTCRNIDILQDPLVVRSDKSIVPALFIQAHDTDRPVRQNADDLPFCPLSVLIRSVLMPGDDKLHLIPLKGPASVFLRDKNILFFPFPADKSKSPCICLKGSCQAPRLPFGILSSLRYTDPALRFQGIQHFLQFLSLIPRYLKQHRNLFDLHRHIEIITDQIIDNFLALFKRIIHILSPLW